MDNGARSYRRFLAGDREGLREIICEYRVGLMLYLNSFVQNIHTAEDLTEETFTRLAIKKPKFSDRSSFKTWLYAIGRNTCVTYLRKNTKLDVVPLESQDFFADEKNIEAEYLKSEQKLALHKALHDLKTEYRQVLYLTYFEGFSNGEAALIMKKSRRQIENLLYNAKTSLKTELERRGFEYEG
ncbi:RNA polymerase sigma factor [Ruminococcus sp.]|uniref:RNA polymerase sigma factor n=1 Tax=Ruminococcus sp. TaxID=41978 RepID=UPI0025CC4BF4|nr:RNA polymerase sigma factor [Ruminococcus sp.]MCR4638786.1 RNA polymerase sigma factor [Ruminococcus sp.]